MNKTAFLVLALLGLAALAGFVSPSGAADEVNDCPAAIGNPNIADPWVRVAIGDPNSRLVDRNGDGFVCSATLQLLRRAVGTLWTDNFIGNPHIIPPGPCTDPFGEVGTAGLPGELRPMDENGDGVLCGSAQFEARALILILLDNPNAVG